MTILLLALVIITATILLSPLYRIEQPTAVNQNQLRNQWQRIVWFKESMRMLGA